VKKGVVVLLLALALLVLVSPGIVGRLAEWSVDESLDLAANDSGEFVVTSSGFDHGWFTSAGQHRIELREGELYTTLLGAFSDPTTDRLPVLLIDTRLDHGLIPLSSMNRENGSLMPGLGSAVSTLSLELADGSITALPGALYSEVGLTGELQSRFLLTADSFAAEDTRVDWGDARFLLTSDARSGHVTVSGGLQSLAIETGQQTAILGRTGIDFDLRQSGYGFRIGPVKLTLDSIAVVAAAETVTAGPFYLQSDSRIVADRLDAELTLRFDNVPLPMGGVGGMRDVSEIEVVARLENVDAAALGILKHSVDAYRAASDYAQMASIDMQGDLLRLLAGGMTLHLDQLDIAGPLGQITSRFSATVGETPVDDISWGAALLALDASADISLPAALVDMAVQDSPDMLAVIGMGFLQKKGDYYVMKAAFKQGLLNINGAPMPVPLTGLQ
jgi:hypothetical protein